MTRTIKISITAVVFVTAVIICSTTAAPQTHSTIHGGHRWLRKPGGMGILRIVPKTSRPIVLYEKADTTAAFDTIVFVTIDEQSRVPAKTKSPEKEAGNGLPESSDILTGPEKVMEYDRPLYDGNRTGKWEYNCNADLFPLNWFTGIGDYQSLELRDAGLSQLGPEMTFRVVKTRKGWVKIVTNENTGSTAWAIR